MKQRMEIFQYSMRTSKVVLGHIPSLDTMNCMYCFEFQRLKAAVHYTVGRICQTVGEDHRREFSRQVIAAIAETAVRQSGGCQQVYCSVLFCWTLFFLYQPLINHTNNPIIKPLGICLSIMKDTEKFW